MSGFGCVCVVLLGAGWGWSYILLLFRKSTCNYKGMNSGHLNIAQRLYFTSKDNSCYQTGWGWGRWMVGWSGRARKEH